MQPLTGAAKPPAWNSAHRREGRLFGKRNPLALGAICDACSEPPLISKGAAAAARAEAATNARRVHRDKNSDLFFMGSARLPQNVFCHPFHGVSLDTLVAICTVANRSLY